MRSASKVIWIGIGTIAIVIGVMIAVSYYNKMTIRELRTSIDLLTANIGSMSRDISSSIDRTQQYIESRQQPPSPPQQYYNVYDESNRDYYYYDDPTYNSEDMLPSIPQINPVNRNVINEISRLTNMRDDRNVRVKAPKMRRHNDAYMTGNRRY